MVVDVQDLRSAPAEPMSGAHTPDGRRHRRRWWERDVLTVEVSPLERAALDAVAWAEIAAAVERDDRAEVRRVRARWRETWDCEPPGRMRVPAGTIRAVCAHIEDCRRCRSVECGLRGDVLSALLGRMCAAVEVRLGVGPVGDAVTR